MSFLYNLLGIFVTFLVIIISRMLWNLSHWKRKKVFYMQPSFPFGNVSALISKKKSIFDIIDELYAKAKLAKQVHGGLYIFSNPQYVPIGLDAVKNILQNDFQHFVDRGMYYNEEVDPLSAHLFALEGNKWRNLRTKLTPTFTSGKMKTMLPILVEITERLVNVIEKEPVKEGLEMKEFMARLTTDIIGSIAFGIECNCIENPDAEFRKYAKILLDDPQNSALSRTILASFPSLMRFLGIGVLPKEFSNFFIPTIKEIVDYRERNNVKRKDFLDLLLQLKNRGKIDDDTNGEIVEGKGNIMTLDTLMAQAFVFYLGGFETTSTTLSFCLYELCSNEEIQDKLRTEVFDVLQRYGNRVTYEALAEMKYMDMVLNETLRKYPPLRVLVRTCTEDYRIPNIGTTLKKGAKVIIPIKSIHYDPEYFPNPQLFDPDRFTEENKKERHPFTFLPFGEGPRVCIGMRFGLMQSKCALAILLKNYKFKLNPQTNRPLKISITKSLTAVEGGIWLDVTPVK